MPDMDIIYHDYIEHIGYIIHQFQPKETIYGAIFRYNPEVLPEADYNELMSRFNDMNAYETPYVGKRFRIPVFARYRHHYKSANATTSTPE